MSPLSLLRDRYQLEEVIGEGALSVVYRAYDLRRHAYVAIKMLRDELVQNPEIMRNFQSEAFLLSKLNHPHIVRFYSFENTGSVAYLVLDYIQGKTLRQLISETKGPFPIEQVSTVFQQIGGALHYAHEEGVLHRDIKPENVIIRSDGNAFLTDFGIAKLVNVSDQAHIRAGTPAYMSPEQIAGKPLDRRSDVYSLGVMLYELLVGKRPFQGDEPGLTGSDTAERIRQAHLWLVPPDPRTLNPSLSEHIALFILKTLAKQPQDRWPDVKSMLDVWTRLIQQGPRSSTQSRQLTTPVNKPFSTPPEAVKPPSSSPHIQPLPQPAATGTTAVLTILHGVHAGTTFPLKQHDLLIGRGEQCQIRIPDPHISRIHCRLRFAQGMWFIQDQNSRNGLFVNGRRVSATRLNPGDQIQIGQSVLEFQLTQTQHPQRRR